MKWKYYLLAFSLLITGFFGCSESTSPKTGKNPVIEDVSLNYSSKEQSLFFSVRANDPQGYEDVKTVVYWMYYLENDSSEEIQLDEGVLTDTGTDGDIIAGDATFTKEYKDVAKGRYRILAEAFDMEDHVSDVVYDTCLAIDNLPPKIYIHTIPNSYEKGDDLPVKIKVTDPNGYDDIKSVILKIQMPDGNFFQDLYLYDDGETVDQNGDGKYGGDEVANDGIFTRVFETSKTSKIQGLWKFYIHAIDKKMPLVMKLLKM